MRPYITMSNKRIHHIKVTPQAHQVVRMLSAYLDKSFSDTLVTSAGYYCDQHNITEDSVKFLVDENVSIPVKHIKAKPILTHKTITHLPLELPPEIRERRERISNGIQHDQPDRFFDKSLIPIEEEEEEVIEEPVVEELPPQPLVMPPLPKMYINPVHGIIRGGK